MLVHRFIGITEIEALLNSGVVNPLAENKRDRLYFWDSEEHTSPAYQLEYLLGIVGEIKSSKTEWRFFCLVSCDISEDRFEKAYRTYADPEGSFWDTICLEELHLYGAYRKEDVKSVRLYVDDRFGFKEDKSFDTIEDAYEFLKS
ncbi:MAG: hypothetical protein J6Q22_09845 [Prevotella sp.]|nr:hypothetical protein [Prevotella sp.]